MIVLDENIIEGQRILLEGWNIAARQIGLDVGRKGLKDEEIVVLLPDSVSRPSSRATWALTHRNFDIGTTRLSWPPLVSMSWQDLSAASCTTQNLLRTLTAPERLRGSRQVASHAGNFGDNGKGL